MGAYGAALIARDNSSADDVSTLLKPDEIDAFSVDISHVRCRGCENNCMMTINKFNDGSRFFTGNRCERGEGKVSAEENRIPDLYEYKFERLFGYDPLPEEKAARGSVGIPKAVSYTHLDVYKRQVISIPKSES